MKSRYTYNDFWLVFETRSPSQRQFSGSCLPMLCSDVYIFENGTRATRQQFKYEAKQNFFKCKRTEKLLICSEELVLGYVKMLAISLSVFAMPKRYPWILLELREWCGNKKCKVQTKNYCKGNNWCQDILWCDSGSDLKKASYMLLVEQTMRVKSLQHCSYVASVPLQGN